MSGKYGPNTAQVAQFIRQLRRLKSGDWHQVAVRASIDSRWRSEDVQRAAASYAEAHLDESHPLGKDITEVVLAVVRKARLQESEAGFVLLASNTAGLALMSRQQISPAHFATLYRPFSDVIPVESLGEGS